MATPNSIPPAPTDTSFTDARGRITLPWRAWLNTLVSLGGMVASLTGDYLSRALNLSDLSNVVTARTNLGLGSAATHDVSDFDAAGAAAAVSAASLQKAANLSDLAGAPTARTNLGLGSAATHDVSDFDPAGAWSSWTGDVAANAHNLSNVGILNTAGAQITSFLAFTGSMYYQPWAVTYFTGPNAGGGAWNEYGYYLQPGATLAQDEFWISVNTRSTLGGADSYAPALAIKALTGTVRFPNAVTFTVAPVFTDPAGSRTALGLGSGLSATVALAKLTAGGANGSLTFVNGVLTAKVDPT